ncbi:MAG TPA: metallophosphoesterase [Vicinamibacterales bacterium]|jgi:predicted phosphodiesterase
MRTLIAGDWHLGTYSRPDAGPIATAFLERARSDGDLVVLNGDIFEGVFEPVARAEAAHSALSTLIARMAREGSILRTEGNHDPGAGAPEHVLEHPSLGRVLVAHGHMADPVHGSPGGRLGDGISRRFGHRAIVRAAAHAVEIVIAGPASPGVDRFFRLRCRSIVERSGCAFGVFGHSHRRYLVRGDAYANAGCLRNGWLEYLLLDDRGPRLERFGQSTSGAGEDGARPATV